MLLEIGHYRIDVDAERTECWYSARNGGVGCGCAGCRNYERAVSCLPEQVSGFLKQFGIRPETPAEMSVLYAPDEKGLCYDGFFHIAGSLPEGFDPWIQTGPKSRMLDQKYLLAPSENCTAYITDDCALVDRDFPGPVLQLHITFVLPWVLDEPNPYC